MQAAISTPATSWAQPTLGPTVVAVDTVAAKFGRRSAGDSSARSAAEGGGAGVEEGRRGAAPLFPAASRAAHWFTHGTPRPLTAASVYINISNMFITRGYYKVGN